MVTTFEDEVTSDDLAQVPTRVKRVGPASPVEMDGRPDLLVERSPDYAGMLLGVEELANIPAPEPLVGSLIDRGSTAVVYGVAGSYKSFLVTGMALSIGSGHPWMGEHTEIGNVIYCAAEGVAGFGQRVTAWRHHEGIDKVPFFRFLPATVPLLSPLYVAAFIEAVRPLNPVAVVFDTLARSMVGGDENSSRDMGQAVRSMDQVRDQTSATVIAVHHSGKDIERGMRGSSALLAGVDTVLSVRADGTRIRLTVERQKNHATTGTMFFDAIEHLGSVVVRRGNPEAIGGITPSALTALAVLARIEVDGGIATGVWLDATELPKRTFYDARRRLLDDGLIENTGSDTRPRYRLTEAGHLEVRP